MKFIASVVIVVVGALGAVGHAQETQRQYLSGKGSDDAVAWEFHCTGGAKSGQWTTILVPSCWDALGFGTLNYFRDGENPEQGKYRHRFAIPDAWRGQHVELVFDGVLTDTQVWINGKPAGEKHQGGFYRFSYDVSGLVKFGGENLLEVTVDKHSANESINRAERDGDYWMFGGIFRPVWIEAKPLHHIERVAIDAKADGTIAVEVFTGGAMSADRVEAHVTTLGGEKVGSAFAQAILDGKTRVEGKIESPRTWTAETPNLYQVEVRLLDGEEVVHRVTQRFGFRTIEVRKGDGIYVNGRRVLLKGTNRHSFWPESGRTTSAKLSRDDVLLMKEMNCNAVRMSHYPPDEHFLDACDELGLYVLDELAGWQKSYDTPTATRLIGQMIRRDVNHPSILVWDNGNEGGWNTEVDDEFAKWDPQQREVLHPWELFRKVNTRHYRSYDEHAKLCAGEDIYLPTEFLHGLFDGGAGAGLAEYWEAMRASKIGGGGFIWAWCDEAIRRPDTGEMDTNRNSAPDGVVGPYREKEASFYAIKEIWSPVVVRRVDERRFEVENRYDFTSTRDCTFTFQVRKFRGPFDDVPEYEVTTGWRQAIDLPPGGKGPIEVKLPAGSDEADALALRVDDPSGREVWTWVWMIFEPRIGPPIFSGPEPRRQDDDGAIKLKSRDVTLTFNKETGELQEVRRGEATIPMRGLRLPIGNAKLRDIEVTSTGPSAVLEAKYDGNLKHVTWSLRNDGWVQLQYAYSLTDTLDYFGVSFELKDEEIKSVRWLGQGPHRVWKNRLAGTTLGVWENARNDTITGYRGWKYPEFAGCYAGVRWMRIETVSGPLVMELDDPSVFVQVGRPKFPGDPKPFSPTTAATRRAPSSQLAGNAWANLPDAGLSILHAIPPIGSKFQLANTTGAAGQQNVAQGEYRGRVRFYVPPK